jgi:peptidoglycan/LPS O-acetylase OafA/YrhL
MKVPVPLGYQPALDGLRAVAVLMVLAFHAGLPWAVGGFLGVDVFFVLSGFLITRLLLEERGGTGSIAVLRFYGRRALRLFPALVALLLAACACALLWLEAPQRDWVLRDLWTSAAYQINWWRVFAPRNPLALSPLDHTWSLAIEEQFYLLWPVSLAALARLGGPRAVALGAAAGALGSALLRALLWESAGLTRTYFGLDTHADGLLVGAAFAAATLSALPAQAPRRGALRAIGPAALLLVVGSAGFVRLEAAALHMAGYVAFALLVVMVIADVLEGGLMARVLAAPPLVWIGRVSYGLYLWHWPVWWTLRFGAPSLGAGATLAIYVAASFTLAALSHRLIERPALRIKDRLAPAARRGVHPT